MRRALALLACLVAPAVAAQLPPYVIEDGGIAAPLAAPGDAARGRALLAARDPANCILCHAAPGVRFAGDLAPPLDGVGARLTPAQLRLRLVDSSRINPATIMPAYYRTEGLTEVAAAWRGRTVLTAAQIEDLVVYLSTLR
ncbi:MAG: sulfur oxidation c-type cytochrome SoxX [Burkholderiales bacterium]|nr:sulfur oxidation c-type cytochrome SoxX [Burkholderiales bacterium]